MSDAIYDKVTELAVRDASEVEARDRTYGSSWEKRGGIGAFMMLARKWDRIEKQVEGNGYDIFATILRDPSESGILDDIADLRRYLLLVEARVRLRLLVQGNKLGVPIRVPAPAGVKTVTINEVADEYRSDLPMYLHGNIPVLRKSPDLGNIDGA